MIFAETPRTPQRALHLALQNEALQHFLAALLEEWTFVLTPDPAAAELVIAEAGTALPPLPGMVLWLSSLGSESANTLHLPTTIPALSAALEQVFHRPPRSHLRVPLELPARLLIRAESVSVSLLSISDAGARFELPRELAPGEKVTISLDIGDRHLLLSSTVIYSFPRTAPGGAPFFSTGVIFAQLPPESQQILGDFIVRRYLQRVRERIPSWAFAVALLQFDLSPSLRLDFDRP
ncbi:MAG: hypothetical protein A2091_01065 [Desulfuromonadales bacterium GWD2_61_12]|nr:MAG: hypothetical protein A2005_04745 [Desulfuromonadales bacterium GWC2_61_20]OGR36799.1 MAG: hypothetical protein A2091_01065 [Desulfuromonadales bacterium GWD2_61_12]HAD03360.1 hypothetical protein [Desulfuromonas sp.]HBT83824.1 hypothetical protein [Desulfuromonas sp.]